MKTKLLKNEKTVKFNIKLKALLVVFGLCIALLFGVVFGQNVQSAYADTFENEENCDVWNATDNDNDEECNVANLGYDDDDQNPDVTINEIDGIYQFDIKSSATSEVFTPQAFSNLTLTRAFEKIAEEKKGDVNFWKKLNDTKTISIKVDRYPIISTYAITKLAVNLAVEELHGYEPLSGDEHLKIDSVYFVAPSLKEVTFKGENCVADLPSCQLVDIERANLSKKCIHNMQGLGDVVIHNIFEQYDEDEINSAIVDVKTHCTCRIDTRDRSSDQGFQLRDGVWKDIDEESGSYDTNPYVSIQDCYGNTEIAFKSSKHSFIDATFYVGFRKFARQYKNNASVWKKLNESQTICLRLDKFFTLRGELFSQDILNEAVTLFWPQYKPVNKDIKIKLISIYSDHMYRVIGSNGIHDLPDLKQVDFAPEFLPENYIQNCPNLENIYIHNWSHGYDPRELNLGFVGVKEYCTCVVHRGGLQTQHYIYTEKSWKGTDGNEDFDPEVKLSDSGDAINLDIESSSTSEICAPQTFSQTTLVESFKKANKLLYSNQQLKNKLNTTKTIKIIVDKYPNIASWAICQSLINSCAERLSGYQSFSDNVKLKVSAVYFKCASEKEVTFTGSNCVSNLPNCTLIDIERVNWYNKCISNMPYLDNVTVHNRSEGYDEGNINAAIENVKTNCNCNILRGIFWSDQHFVYNGQSWSKK